MLKSKNKYYFIDLEAKAKEDPYEEKLYYLFNSHSEKVGFLNKIQLDKLCTTLQLNAPKSLQLKDLLTEKCDKITFQQFREGLLKIITAEGKEQIAYQISKFCILF